MSRRALVGIAGLTGLLALPPALAAPAPARPIVWVQAGHQAPGEPGYRAQTGAAGEATFTARLAAEVERRLRELGVDARHTPAKVTPRAAGGAVFISLHYDTPSGRAAVGHAISGAGENWYQGEGTGHPSSTPYSDSAPHRAATTVSPAVEARSSRLAALLQKRYAAVFTPSRGARSGPVQLVPRNGNRRMMRFYGYYRTRAAARVLIETGAGKTDAAMLRRTDVIARAITGAIVAHLKAEGTLPG